MPEWYEIPHGQRTDEQNRRAQQAYYLALLSTQEGKEVILDMKRRVNEIVPNSAYQSDNAVAQLWLEGFLKDTLNLCGANNPVLIVEAQARSARSYIHQEEEPDIPEDYAE